MSDFKHAAFGAGHDHIFLGVGHEKNERKTWAVIALCSAMMLIEIVGGSMFGSLALVADGLHMSTHAGAMRKTGGTPSSKMETASTPDGAKIFRTSSS